MRDALDAALFPVAMTSPPRSTCWASLRPLEKARNVSHLAIRGTMACL